MKDCETIRELLPWYASGTLEGDEARAVTAHLASCDACQEELALVLRLRRGIEGELRRLPNAPDGMWRRVAAEAFGRPLGRIDVGSFLVGFSLGANIKRGGVPVYGDLRLLGRRMRLFNVKQEEST